MRVRWVAFVLGGCLALTVPASGDEMAYGRALVVDNCARCHAIDAADASAHAEAPAFRGLLQRYPIDALEEAFAHSIVTGHPDMPEFVGTPEQIAAIIDYIASVQE